MAGISSVLWLTISPRSGVDQAISRARALEKIAQSFLDRSPTWISRSYLPPEHVQQSVFRCLSNSSKQQGKHQKVRILPSPLLPMG